MIVVGARPNFMKAAPLVREMRAQGFFDIKLVHTGQHFDDNMSKVFFDELGLPRPDVYLNINRASQTEQVARVMMALEGEVRGWVPDFMIVVGDVNSTLAAALVASKMSVKLAHVEAGLRSFDRTMPEEINRLLVDQMADYLFTPSRDADQNLMREGIPKEKIFCVGNIMVDTLLKHLNRALELKAWGRFKLKPCEYGVVTLHRPSNVDDDGVLSDIISALITAQEKLPLLFPVHPRTKARLEASGWLGKLGKIPRIILAEPFGYLENLSLMAKARLVITDSGGIQEETTVLGIPCLTVRANTERPITISQGTNRLVGQSKKGILDGFEAAWHLKPSMAKSPELWDGHTAKRLVDILASVFRIQNQAASSQCSGGRI